MSQGFLGFVGLAKETTWGTAVAAADYAEMMSESLSMALDRFEVKNIIGAAYESDDLAGVQRVSGDLVTAGYPIVLGHLLKGAMNTVSGSVVLSGFLYTTRFVTPKSDFSAADTPMQPFTFEVHRDVTSSFRYAGMCVNKLTMSLAPNQDLRLSASLLGKSVANIAKSTPTFPGSPANPFSFETASISIAGAGNAKIEAFSVSIDNQLDGIPALNASNNIIRVRRRGPQMLRISGTFDFQDITEYLDFINQTERALTVSLTRTNSFQFVIDIPRFVYRTFPVGIPGRDRLTVQFEGMPRYLSSSGTAIDFRLTSTKSDY